MEWRIILLLTVLFWIGLFQLSAWLLTYLTVFQFSILAAILVLSCIWWFLYELDRAKELAEDEW